MKASAPRPPFAVQRIDHIVFRVRDLRRSIAFYESVLGCSVVRTREELGLVHLRAGAASMIDLVSVDGQLGRRGGAPAGNAARNVDHLCLRIDPFNEGDLVRHFAAHGLAPREAPAIRFGGEGAGPSLYICDPDGNEVELKGPSK